MAMGHGRSFFYWEAPAAGRFPPGGNEFSYETASSGAEIRNPEFEVRNPELNHYFSGLFLSQKTR
jgi:hypothetical protein